MRPAVRYERITIGLIVGAGVAFVGLRLFAYGELPLAVRLKEALFLMLMLPGSLSALLGAGIRAKRSADVVRWAKWSALLGLIWLAVAWWWGTGLGHGGYDQSGPPLGLVLIMGGVLVAYVAVSRAHTPSRTGRTSSS